ncbi:MAG: pyridine nucleotide-disulfide oxidoreductase [Clostridiales bacterium GWF2_38_85]|nr:MAG: pyridine nucleotide-disulfide oxidoreductase [Clostridiales bacterium GWF2_38_85]HBL84455.1 NAD(P)/FAD-dependent oxidoreductase [Clostridiales bacterium]
MNYVIIGNSAAGIGCVEGIRNIDKDNRITIISDEAQHTYSRPLISYLLEGKTDINRMKYRPDDFYKNNKCDIKLSTRVTSIDNEKKTVSTDKDEIIPYDKLLVATGSRAFVPPFNGLDSVPHYHTFMKLDDALALDNDVKENSRIFIIGAGLIGLKCAESLHYKTKNIIIADLAERILPNVLDNECASIMQQHLEEKGFTFMLADSVEVFEGKTAKMKSGKTIDFDVLIIAVGVRPNTELVKAIGGNVNRGIVIDEHCNTSLPDIYAAGDCTESYDISADVTRILAILPNAYIQGECAGKNMAGSDCIFNKAIPMNATGLLGMHMITAGSYDGVTHIVKSDDTFKKLFVKDNRLVGYIIIGDVLRAGIYTALIRNKTPLDSIDFELIKDKPQLMAFSRTDRAKFLGSVV